MQVTFSLEPNQLKEPSRIMLNEKNYKEITGVYVGKHTYCWNTFVDSGTEFSLKDERVYHNLHIGNFNSIGNGLKLIFGRNHNIKRIDTGAVELMLQDANIPVNEEKTSFNQKGSIVIQNDVWFGENVTVMAGVTIRNGAVIARNSHVVKDVPPYAVVGGNPAQIIGYRFSREQIEKLQKIQWWYWNDEKIKRNAALFSEDIDRFCSFFFREAEQEFLSEQQKRKIEQDTYFVFVDYYENYCSYPYILESFLDKYMLDCSKKLLLFVRDDLAVDSMEDEKLTQMEVLLSDIKKEKSICCSVEMEKGTVADAKNSFLKCSHYIINRTFDTVYFSCLADRLGIEIISGADSFIQFETIKNFIKVCQ